MTSTKMTADVDTRGTKLHIVTWAKRPNLVRRETDGTPPPPTPGRVSIPGSTGPVKVVVASDGTTVWTINPMMGEGARRSPARRPPWPRTRADFDSGLIDYKGKGTTIELVGSEPINGKPAHHLKLTKKNGLVEDYYLEIPGNRPGSPEEDSLRTGRGADRRGDRPVELPDRRRPEPAVHDEAVGQWQPGIAEITVSKWEVNIPIDDELFKMPAKK